MSTTFNIYPSTSVPPLIEAVRARGEELLQQFYEDHGIHQRAEIRALHYPDSHTPTPVPAHSRYKIDFEFNFIYYVDGNFADATYSTCFDRELIDHIDIEWGWFPPEMIGTQRPLDPEEFQAPITPEEFEVLDAQDRYYHVHRSAGSSPVASTGYGFLAIALAEITSGRINSWDCAFEEEEHEGLTAEHMLSWWGEEKYQQFKNYWNEKL